MNQHGNSKTQQLIYRSSYKKHRERLIDIKQNSTSNDFFLIPKAKVVYQSRKVKQHSKTKKDQEQPEHHMNHINSNKLETLKGKSTGLNEPLSSNSFFKRSDRRKYNHEEQKMEINSDFQGGQQIKCILPKANRAQSFSTNNNNLKQAKLKHYVSYTTKYGSIDKNRRKSQNYQASSANQINEEGNPVPTQLVSEEIYFNLPQRNPNRKVLYKKTLILGSMQSCLIQICQLNGKYLIVAYIMGLQSYTIRYYLSQKQSRQFTNQESFLNYDEYCKRIVVDKFNKHYEIKIRARQNSPQNRLRGEKVENQQSHQKKKLKVQNQFLKRNFYTLMKNEEENNNQPPKQAVQQANKQVITSLVARLAVPKRFFKYRDQITTNYHTEDTKVKKESIDRTLKVSVDKVNPIKNNDNLKVSQEKFKQPKSNQNLKISQQIINPARQLNSLKHQQLNSKSSNINKPPSLLAQSKEKITKNDSKNNLKNDQKIDKIIIKSPQITETKLQSKISQKPSQKQSQNQDIYNQQFQNSSSLLKSHKSPIQNSSIISQQIKNQSLNVIKIKQKQQNLYEDVYQQQFQNDSLNPNKSKQSNIIKQQKKRLLNDEQIVEDNYQQDYQAQFENKVMEQESMIIDESKNKSKLKQEGLQKHESNRIEESYEEDFS